MFLTPAKRGLEQGSGIGPKPLSAALSPQGGRGGRLRPSVSASLGALFRVLVLCPYALLSASPSQGAAFRGAYPGCADKEVAKQAFKEPSGAKSAALLKSKVDAGLCIQFSKGQQVSIDERDGSLWCVRRTGDLDCYWTLDKAVDPNPPITSGGGGQGGGQTRRKGGQ